MTDTKDDKSLVADRLKLLNKIAKASKHIQKIDKNKKGFNFTYADGDEIRKEVNKQSNENKFLVNAPTWYVNPLKGITAGWTKEGKEFVIDGTIILSITDLETGYTLETFVPGVQSGTDAMQAKGSAESYAMRQWLKELFSVVIDKEEDVAEKKYIFDKNGNPVQALTMDQINELVKSVVDNNKITPDNLDIVKTLTADAITKYNSKYGTNHGKLSEFPVSELDELKPFILAVRIA